MEDPRVQKLGHLLVNYSVAVQPGDQVAIRGSLAAMPLVTAAYRAVIQAGGHPHIWIRDNAFKEILLKEGNEQQIEYVSPVDAYMIEKFDCLISISAETNTRALNNIDPSRQQLWAKGYEKLMKPFMQRSATGELRWVGTLFPTEAHAQDADMSLSEFEDFVYAACLLNEPNPVEAWKAVKTRHDKLINWLAGKQNVHVKGSNIDLTLSIAERTFINGDGCHNMPCGEIFTGPVEESVNGWVRYTYPAIYQGREVEGIEMHFENGKVVSASAKKNEAFLHSVLDTDPGARYLGEFAIGTNRGVQQFTRSILFDEKINGTIHMAVGRSYPESGGKNISNIHWDMICDMQEDGQIWVDDELFYEKGEFLKG